MINLKMVNLNITVISMLNLQPIINHSRQSLACLLLTGGFVISSTTVYASTPAIAPDTEIASAPMADISNTALQEHTAKDVDISQPILAEQALTSLQHTKPLEFDLPTIHRFETTSGIPVAFVSTDQLPIVDVSLRFNAGSARDESIRADAGGLASLTAQMLSKGTTELNETEFATEVENLGVNLAGMAYKDQLVITLRSLSDADNLEPAVRLVNAMLRTPRFDADVLARSKAQQTLILKSMEQSPAFLAQRAFDQVLYGDHPYADMTFGSLATVPTITTEDIQTFWRRYGVANNASLSITGDLTLSEAKRMAENLTQGLKAGSPATTLPVPKPPKPQQININYASDQTYVLMGQLGNAISADPKTWQQQSALTIGNEILAGSGFNSRLMQAVRKREGYTYGIYGAFNAMQTTGPYQISFSTRNAKAQDAIDLTLEVIEDTLTDGVTQSEFELTKQSIVNAYPMSFASNASMNQTLGALTFYELPDSFITDYPKRIENMAMGEVNQALRKKINPDDFIIITVGQPDFDDRRFRNTP